MDSKIAEAIKLINQPVAVIRTNISPQNAISFKANIKRGCVVAMFVAATQGKTAVFNEETTPCNGGKAGLGLKDFESGFIEYFLSTGGTGAQEGEFYKKTPELARDYITNVPQVEKAPFIVFKPLCDTTKEDKIEAVVFLVNADQLSALTTLANYDQPVQDMVKLYFGAGCAQAFLYAISENEKNGSYCYIGMTDPSARKCISKDLLSFSIPYNYFLHMEDMVNNSFLIKETWQIISKRI